MQPDPPQQDIPLPKAIPLPSELRSVPHDVLEEYCRARLSQFSRVFASILSPGSSQPVVEAAFNRALQLSGGDEGESQEQHCLLRFGHRCRFIGCMSKDCGLCKNNPNKRCPVGDNLDECYADCQVLRSKCEAEVFVELVNTQTQKVMALPGMEIQVSIIDGESWSEAQPSSTSRVRELLKSDEGFPLLACSMPGHKVHPSGRIILKIQNGHVKLPDVSVTDKNDTFHHMGASYGSFRLMACAVKRDLYSGNLQVVESIPPAITGKFIVKTQRAISDYRKCEYPHYKDELTKLKFVGNITAQRLRDIQAHLGQNAPFSSISTVEQMKHLVLYADQNRTVENKLLDLLNMKGKHKHKWDYLRDILLERVVYDDQAHRAWYSDNSKAHGLVYASKQAQINFDKPLGLLQRTQQGLQTVLQVFTQPTGATADLVKAMKVAAEQAWGQPGHPGWTVVTDCMELLGASGPSLIMSPAGTQSGPPLSPPPLSAPMHPPSPTSSTLRPQRSGHRSRRNSSQPIPQAIKPERSSDAAAGMSVPFFGPLPLEGARAVSMPALKGLGGVQEQQFMLYQQLQQQQHALRSQGNTMMGSSKSMPPLPPMPTPSQNRPLPETHPIPASFQFQPVMSRSMQEASGLSSLGDTPAGKGSSRQQAFSDVMMMEPEPSKHSAPVMSRTLHMEDYAVLSGSGRLRRMSADAAGCAQQATELLPVRGTGGSMSDLGKRSRTSAPDGLVMHNRDGDEVQSISNSDAMRLNLYHQESKGRHLPSRRTCEGRTSPNTSSVNTIGAFNNDADFAQIFSMLNGGGLEHEQAFASRATAVGGSTSPQPKVSLRDDPFALCSSFPLAPPSPHQQLQAPPPHPTALPHQQPLHTLPPALGQLLPHEQQELQQAFEGIDGPPHLPPLQVPPSSPHDSSGTDTASGAQRTMSQRLSSSMRQNLRIRSDSPQEQPEQSSSSQTKRGTGAMEAAAAAAVAAEAMAGGQSYGGESLGGAARVLNHSDSDSFNRNINRVWQHSESDSFKNLLASLASPTGGGPTGDPDLDELLRPHHTTL